MSLTLPCLLLGSGSSVVETAWLVMPASAGVFVVLIASVYTTRLLLAASSRLVSALLITGYTCPLHAPSDEPHGFQTGRMMPVKC